MTRITASVDEDDYEHVETVADELDVSLAEVIRRLIAAHRRGDVDSDALNRSTSMHDVMHDVEQIDDLRDRVDELEERVGQLEADRSESTTADENAIEAALDGWRPGRNLDERQPRRESGRAVLQWLREQPGPVTASDVKHALFEDHGVEQQTEQTWWEQTARAALQHAAGRGYVEVDGIQYQWIGE